MKGENTSSAIQKGKTPSLAPHRESVAARRPSVDEPTSPMNIRAGGKLKKRNPAEAAAMIRLTARNASCPAVQPMAAKVPNPNTAMPPANPPHGQRDDRPAEWNGDRR